MERGKIIINIFIFSLFCFIVISLAYTLAQRITLLFPESSSIFIIVDDNQSSFWSSSEGVKLLDESNIKIRGLNSLIINSSLRKSGELFKYSYNAIQNWSDKTFFSFYWYGQGSGNIFRIHILTPDWNNRAYFDFYDNFKGWKKILLLLHTPSGTIGNYDLSQVKSIIWALPNMQAAGIWYLDKVMVEEETFWLTLLVNFEGVGKNLIYFFAIALALSGIMTIKKLKENHKIPESTKTCIKDHVIYIFLSLFTSLFVWLILKDIEWLAYIISLMSVALTYTLLTMIQKIDDQ